MKAQLQADLTAAMRARDEVKVATLRMALAAITKAEVAGKEQIVLSDAEVVGVLRSEIKKRHDAAEMFETLAKHGVNFMAISTSEIKVSCLIEAKYTELAVRVLHERFGLEKKR